MPFWVSADGRGIGDRGEDGGEGREREEEEGGRAIYFVHLPSFSRSVIPRPRNASTLLTVSPPTPPPSFLLPLLPPVAKGAVVAATYANDTAALGYMDVAFDRQSDVLNEQTIDMTYTEVSELVQGWVRDITGLSDKKVKEGLKEGTVEEAVRFSFKYAAIRSVYGTPTYMINQMVIPGLDSESTVEDWRKYLEPLLARAERED